MSLPEDRYIVNRRELAGGRDLLAELEQAERELRNSQADRDAYWDLHKVAAEWEQRAEQAERERDEARSLGVSDKITAWYDADAKAAALAEALRWIAAEKTGSYGTAAGLAREALAAYEQEQKP